MGPEVTKPKDGHTVGNLELISQRMNKNPPLFCTIVYELSILDMVEGVTKT